MRKETLPPPRKEKGIVSKLFSSIFSLFFWMVAALVVSIVVEWIGIAFFWKEQGSMHSQYMLKTEIKYLDERVSKRTSQFESAIYNSALEANKWFVSKLSSTKTIQWLSTPVGNNGSNLFNNYKEYILSGPNITQLFIVRVAIVLFSLPVFIMFAIVGMVDGLVERDLRKWGGGRESSNIYNLARKAIFPSFIAACFIYISMPITMHPTVIIMPFALLCGYSVRLTFSSLKKYF